MRMMRRVLVALMFAGCVSWSSAGTDWQLDADGGARALLAKSAFIHGYIHGNEQAFHVADLDLQLGRGARDPEKLNEFRHVAGYQDGFGDRSSFDTGYYQGFRVGYADSFSERAFRALNELRAAAQGLAEERDPKPSKQFDQALSDGYKNGVAQGRRDAASGMAAGKSATPCDPLRRSAEYCDAFTRGYGIGYSDGYLDETLPVLAQGK